LGEAILLGSVPLLVWFLVFFALSALTMLLIEEPLLESRFGSDYVTYNRGATPATHGSDLDRPDPIGSCEQTLQRRRLVDSVG
jgi:hypothetical protein